MKGWRETFDQASFCQPLCLQVSLESCYFWVDDVRFFHHKRSYDNRNTCLGHFKTRDIWQRSKLFGSHLGNVCIRCAGSNSSSDNIFSVHIYNTCIFNLYILIPVCFYWCFLQKKLSCTFILNTLFPEIHIFAFLNKRVMRILTIWPQFNIIFHIW